MKSVCFALLPAICFAVSTLTACSGDDEGSTAKLENFPPLPEAPSSENSEGGEEGSPENSVQPETPGTGGTGGGTPPTTGGNFVGSGYIQLDKSNILQTSFNRKTTSYEADLSLGTALPNFDVAAGEAQ